MAIFNELITDLLLLKEVTESVMLYEGADLEVLNEKRSREDYHRESFKKKYNFEPSKEDKDIGTITDKQGKKYKVDMRKSKLIFDDDNKQKRKTLADLNSKDSTIYLDKKFFKLKGSNKSARRDAILQHEIGHQNLHNTNADNSTVDTNNRTLDNYRYSKVNSQDKAAIGKDYASKGKKYVNSSTASNNDEKRRKKDIENAGKFSTDRIKPIEFEANRYAANHSSENAVKKALYSNNKLNYKEMDEDKRKKKNDLLRRVHDDPTADHSKKERKRIAKGVDRIFAKEKKDMHDDYVKHTKALKDKNLRDSETYK